MRFFTLSGATLSIVKVRLLKLLLRFGLIFHRLQRVFSSGPALLFPHTECFPANSKLILQPQNLESFGQVGQRMFSRLGLIFCLDQLAKRFLRLEGW